MKKVLLFVLFTIFANAEYLGTYYARLGVSDHFNSHGSRLWNTAAIIRQDRFNYHVRGIQDLDDTGDYFFDNKENRDKLEAMLRRGYISRAARRAILNGTPTIRVKIYRDHIIVKIISKSTRSVVE